MVPKVVGSNPIFHPETLLQAIVARFFLCYCFYGSFKEMRVLLGHHSVSPIARRSLTNKPRIKK